MQTMKCQKKNRTGVPPAIHRSIHRRVRCMASSTRGPSVVVLTTSSKAMMMSAPILFCKPQTNCLTNTTQAQVIYANCLSVMKLLRLVSHRPKQINKPDMPVGIKPVLECKIQQIQSLHTLSIGIWKELPVFESTLLVLATWASHQLGTARCKI
jgi:hypothetical protein